MLPSVGSRQRCSSAYKGLKDTNWSLLEANKNELLLVKLVKSGGFEVSTVQCVIAVSNWVMTLSRVNPEWQDAFQEGEKDGRPRTNAF